MNDLMLVLDVVAFFVEAETAVVLHLLARLCEAVCGVAAGGVRSAITQHFAQRDNTADVAAKEGSQETAVHVLGTLASIAIAVYIPLRGESPPSGAVGDGASVSEAAPVERLNAVPAMAVFAVLTVVHLYANVVAVRALRLTSLNPNRLEVMLNDIVGRFDVEDDLADEEHTTLRETSGSTDHLRTWRENFDHVESASPRARRRREASEDHDEDDTAQDQSEGIRDGGSARHARGRSAREQREPAPATRRRSQSRPRSRSRSLSRPAPLPTSRVSTLGLQAPSSVDDEHEAESHKALPSPRAPTASAWAKVAPLIEELAADRWTPFAVNERESLLPSSRWWTPLNLFVANLRRVRWALGRAVDFLLRRGCGRFYHSFFHVPNTAAHDTYQGAAFGASPFGTAPVAGGVDDMPLRPRYRIHFGASLAKLKYVPAAERVHIIRSLETLGYAVFLRWYADEGEATLSVPACSPAGVWHHIRVLWFGLWWRTRLGRLALRFLGIPLGEVLVFLDASATDRDNPRHLTTAPAHEEWLGSAAPPSQRLLALLQSRTLADDPRVTAYIAASLLRRVLESAGQLFLDLLPDAQRRRPMTEEIAHRAQREAERVVRTVLGPVLAAIAAKPRKGDRWGSIAFLDRGWRYVRVDGDEEHDE